MNSSCEGRCLRFQVMQWVQSRDEPLRLYLSGGAGVGKSVLCRQLIRSLSAYYEKLTKCLPGCPDDSDRPDRPLVLVMAPTGTLAWPLVS